MSRIVEILRQEEGFRAHAYDDMGGEVTASKGFVTIGTGHLIHPGKGAGIPQHIDDMWTEHVVNMLRAQLVIRAPWVSTLGPVRINALLNMMYQLGASGVIDGFPKMMEALKRGDYQAAGEEARDSDWWRHQTRARAERIARALETGEDQWE